MQNGCASLPFIPDPRFRFKQQACPDWEDTLTRVHYFSNNSNGSSVTAVTCLSQKLHVTLVTAQQILIPASKLPCRATVRMLTNLLCRTFTHI